MELITQVIMIIILVILLFMAYKNRKSLSASLYEICHEETTMKSCLKKQNKKKQNMITIDNISQISDISLETPVA